MMRTRTRGATGNIQKDVGLDAARQGLGNLIAKDPDYFGVQEWKRGRNRLLRDLGKLYVGPIKRARRKIREGYVCARPLIGGAPVGLKAERSRLRRCYGRVLVGPGRVDKSPGRRSVLGPSIATVAVYRDTWLGETSTLINAHLTAEVQREGRYRADRPRRVARHQREVAALNRLIAKHQRKGRIVRVLVDGNFDGLELHGLHSCWDGRKGGTLGSRAVDIIFGPDEFDDVQTVDINSDHRGVAADEYDA